MSLTDQSIELPEPSQKPSAEQSLKSEEPRAEIIEAMEQQPANPPTLKLPTDRPRPAVQSFHGATRHFNLSSGLTGKLNTLSRHENVSLFITLLAAFHTLLHRYSGQDDIMTGTPARRDTLALRTDLSNNPGFRDLLVQVGANANQDIPLKPVETLHPQRDRSGNPLFQVMFELKNSLDNRRPLNEARAGFLQADSETILFDLGLELSEAADGLTGRLKYATDLFDVSTIDRLIGHFQTLLEGIVTQPEARLSELPLLTEAERRQLLVNWNDTAASFPDDKCIHELFEAQAAATPQAVAVIHEQNRITYAELNAQANRLAHHLCGLGVKPDTRVAICAERNLNMVVGLLAILKAGGAYVPLDPAYPKERLEFMLEDCSPLALLTQGRFESLFAGITSDLKVIDLEAEHPPWANRPGTNPDRSQQGLDPKHLAYVIYTSGSTGTPKGVMIEHRGLCNMITDLRNRYRIRAEDRILQFVAIAFDVSVQDIFSALLSGAALVLRSDEWIANAGKFWALCEQNKVSIVTLPTLFWQQLAQDEQAVIPATIRQIIIGGEAVNNKVLAAWFERKSYRPKLFNEYGPTETTVNATIYQPLADSLSWQSIGRPIANMRVYILDACRQPVPIGLTGELYIAGAGVARGYLNRPDLTAERFIADPFTTEAEARMYKTGDLARWLADGTLEFVGRNDFQVKIRGFRIELGDIEAKLAEHPAVRQAAVSAHEDREGFKHLVAYVVLQDDFTPDIAELRDFLKRKMPEFMLPSAFMFPAALPVTPNGKLDRKALPVPDMSHRLQHDGFIAPRSPMEELIAGIWSEILSVAAIGSQDNFFEQGGDSLLALQFISRFRERLALEIPLRTLFDLPTVTELAAHLESRLLTGEPAQLPAISRSPRVGALPPSFAQMQMWLLERISGASRVYNLPFSLRLKQVKDQGRALERALNEIIRRHEALRTCLAEQEGSPFQLILPALPVNLLKADLRNISEELREIEIGRQIQADTAAAFELNQAPLFRAKLIRLGAEEYLFFIVFHHIIFDAWSKEVFARELSALYGAFSQGLPSPLPELPIQYADYAVRQREWLQGEPLNRLSAYWKARLANASTLELPTDRPRPAVQSFRGATQQFNLPSDLTGKLKTLSRHEGVTLFMTLAAAFQLLLHRYSGQDDIVIGTPVAGRSRLELEGLIGFFVNTLVLRADLSGNPSFRELLAQVREVTLGAYAHQDMPFEKLVEALNPQRDRSRNPLFQVMFTLQNIPDDKRPLNQMTAETLQFDSGTAKFDLTFELSETPQGLTGGVEYATDLFEAATISRLIGHFQTLLEGIAARPEARLSDLPLLTEAERRQLLTDWNDTAVSFPEHRCIHELFEAQAAATPQAPALVYEQSRLGYAELNAQANRLAHHLCELGVKPDARVAICVERGLTLVVGLLAILKAGGAYVPLDPAYPKDRLEFMLEDSAPVALLTQGRLESLFAGMAKALPMIDLEAEHPPWANRPDTNLERHELKLTPQHLAYVIYTSGSTGKPKGVMVEHINVVNFLCAMAKAPGLSAADSLLAVTTVSFDIAGLELFLPLIKGAKIVLISRANAADAAFLQQTIAQSGITVMQATPATWRLLLNGGWQGSSGLKALCGGEALATDLSTPLRQAVGELWNLYGPTETTVWSTGQVIDNGRGELYPYETIGRPIDNSQIYILDEHRQPVPPGVSGEIYIGGAGVARGYLNRPELTAERFVSDPFAAKADARMYKTGDLARWLADGSIEYLGRNDFQVKIRGFRIEIGEIEAVLRQHPQLGEVAVGVYEPAPGDKRLAAYVAPRQNAPVPTAAELRDFLKPKLPEFMLPSAFVFLDALPLTPNGKLDRKALPEPDRNRPVADTEFIAPRNPIEQQLAEIWAEVLKLNRIGIYDNFFALGGHSLLATQVIVRIGKQLSVDIPLNTLFEAPTVEALAKRIENTVARLPNPSKRITPQRRSAYKIDTA